MEGEAAFVADRVIAVSERLKRELCDTYQLPEAQEETFKKEIYIAICM